jgi:heat shock protein HslJ
MSIVQPRRLLAAILALVLSGCASKSEPVAAPQPSGPGALVQTLQDHRWTLESATDARGQRLAALSHVQSIDQGRPFVFNFAGSRLSIQGGCNPLIGGFQVSPEGQLNVGRMASGMMACEPALMQRDAALSALLAKPMNTRLVPGTQPTLRLTTTANDTLVLVGQKTPEARYGAPTIIFLEVAPQPVACHHPLIPNSTCLQVRERRYDEQGLVVGTPGAWRPLYENIEGFTHRAGERNVVRVKRFQRTPVPADASSNLYVLDLVIESEIVPK